MLSRRPVAGGDEAILSEYKRFWADMRGMAARLNVPDSDTDDLIAEVVDDLCESPKKMDVIGRFRDFMFGAIRYKWLGLLRKRDRERRSLNRMKHEVVGWTMGDRIPDDLSSILVVLNAQERAAVILRYSDEKTDMMAAEAMHMEQSSFRKLVSRAIAKLRGAYVAGVE
jgi:RNA polymerase sigma factor (sigma-70 family)